MGSGGSKQTIASEITITVLGNDKSERATKSLIKLLSNSEEPADFDFKSFKHDQLIVNVIYSKTDYEYIYSNIWGFLYVIDTDDETNDLDQVQQHLQRIQKLKPEKPFVVVVNGFKLEISTIRKQLDLKTSIFGRNDIKIVQADLLSKKAGDSANKALEELIQEITKKYDKIQGIVNKPTYEIKLEDNIQKEVFFNLNEKFDQTNKQTLAELKDKSEKFEDDDFSDFEYRQQNNFDQINC